MNVREAYRLGFEAGVRAYAWWKDGRQEVGTTGRLLSTAIEKVEETWNWDPPPEVFYVREATGRWYPDAMPRGEIVISRVEDPESSTGESFKITANAGMIVEGAGTYGSIHEARRDAERLKAFLSGPESGPIPRWAGSSEACEACGAPAGVVCPEDTEACRAVCSCPTHGPTSIDVKLASLIVLADEATGPNAHELWEMGIRRIVEDPEVLRWLGNQDPALLPVKRQEGGS